MEIMGLVHVVVMSGLERSFCAVVTEAIQPSVVHLNQLSIVLCN